MPKLAARMNDLTQHGGQIMPPCALFTKIENQPAARLTDMHTCPMVTGVVPHVGGPIILASFTTFIENLPAARVQDMLICVGPPDQIQMGAMNTYIGDPGGGAMGTMSPPASSSAPAAGGGSSGSGSSGGSGSGSGSGASSGSGSGSGDGSQGGAPADGQAGAPIEQATTEGDPVDVATGCVFTFVEEFTTQGRPALTFRRVYSTSAARTQSALGWGWTHSLDEQITTEGDFLVYRDAQGRRVLFPVIPVGEYLHHLDEQVTFWRMSDHYRLDAEGVTRIFESPSGAGAARLTRLEDATGRTLTLEYAGERLHQLTDALGNRYRFESQDGRHITAVLFQPAKDGSERALARYVYDSAGHLLVAYDALSAATRYYYDAHHHLIQRVDRNGHAFSFEYDHKNRCIRAYGPNGLQEQKFLYNENEPMTTVRDTLGNVTTYRYNALGLVTKVVDAQGGEQTYRYTGAHLTQRADALSRIWKWERDKYARVVKQTTPGGAEIVTEYFSNGSQRALDAEGKSLEVRHEQGAFLVQTKKGQPTLFTARQILLNRQDAKNAKKNREKQGEKALDSPFPVSAANAVGKGAGGLGVSEANESGKGVGGLGVELEDAQGNITTLLYDEADRLSACILPLGQELRFEYDACGNRVSVTDSTGAAVRYAYDNHNRLTRIDRDGGSGFQFQYDGEGNLAFAVDGNGHTRRWQYAPLARLAAIIQPDGRATRFEYDIRNALRKLTDGRGAQWTYDYDSLGRPQRCLHPDGLSDFWTFDAAGQVKRFVDRGGVGVDVTRDLDGRITSLNYVDGVKLELEYDKSGRVLSAVKDESSVTFAYDDLGRLLSETQNGATVAYEYDELGALGALTLPTGESAHFLRDANGRIVEVVDWDGGAHRFEYAANGPLKTHTFPNGLSARAAHSRLGLPTQIGLGRAGAGRPLAMIGLRYDGNDAVTEYADSLLGSALYAYDSSGRLATATRGNAARSEKFAYDASDNLAARGPLEAHLFDPCNRLQSAPDLRAQYDRRGFLVRLDDAARGAFRFAYDGAGMLTQAQLPDGTVVEYAYDAFGRRALKRHGDIETHYLWAGDQLLGEKTITPHPPTPSPARGEEESQNRIAPRPLRERGWGEGEETRWYLFLPGTFQPLTMRVNGAPYYFHTDHRDAPTRLSDAQGEIVWTAEISAWGEAYVQTEQVTQNLRLPGQYYDAETGLHYNRARYYDPQQGRYLTPDPQGFHGGLNLYAYAANDPINQSDPLGMAPRSGKGKSIGQAAGQAGGPNGSISQQASDNSNLPSGSPTADTLQSNPSPTVSTPAQSAAAGAIADTPPPDNAPPPAQGTADCSSSDSAQTQNASQQATADTVGPSTPTNTADQGAQNAASAAQPGNAPAQKGAIMNLPNAENAVVQPGKAAYLLNSDHRNNQKKGDFFARFGFTQDKGKEFADAIARHGKENPVIDQEQTPFGMKYRVVGPLQTPDGRNPIVLTAWIVEHGKTEPRLVTAHPHKL